MYLLAAASLSAPVDLRVHIPQGTPSPASPWTRSQSCWLSPEALPLPKLQGCCAHFSSYCPHLQSLPLLSPSPTASSNLLKCCHQPANSFCPSCPPPMPWQRVQDCLYQPIPAPTPAPFTATNSLSWAQHTLKDNFSSREARRCLPPEPRSGNNA